MGLSHSRIAPSGMGRTVHCSGSVVMQEKYPDEESKATKEGTASHWVGDLILSTWKKRGYCKLPPRDFTNRTAPNGIVVNQEMADCASVYIQDVLNFALVRGLTAQLNVEERVHAVPIHPESWGTPDCWVYDPVNRELIIWDYKFGYLVIEAFENYQLINYICGIIYALGLSDQGLTVRLRVVQPRPYHRDGRVREWKTTATDLRPHINLLHMAAAEALGPNPILKSGSHCRNCNAIKACPANQKAALAAFDYIENACSENLDNATLSSELHVLRRAYQAIDYRLEAIETEVTERIKRGESMPEWVLEPGNGKKVWAMPPKKVFALGDLMGVELRKKEAPITPVQAKSAGLSETTIKACSKVLPGSLKLVSYDDTKAKEIFKQ